MCSTSSSNKMMTTVLLLFKFVSKLLSMYQMQVVRIFFIIWLLVILHVGDEQLVSLIEGLITTLKHGKEVLSSQSLFMVVSSIRQLCGKSGSLHSIFVSCLCSFGSRYHFGDIDRKWSTFGCI